MQNQPEMNPVNVSVSPELQQRFSSYLDSLETTVTNSKDFVLDQAPDIAQQYVAWEFWNSLTSIGLGSIPLIISILIAICFYFYIKNKTKLSDDEQGFGVFIGFISIVSLIIFSITSATCLPTVVKTKIAPKVIIMEKVSDLIRNNR